MLRELLSARQIPGETKRRWFSSNLCDLIVWVRDDDSPEGFQFSYDKGSGEHALTWTNRGGFSHMEVDPGDKPAGHKGAPILLANGMFEAGRILDIFRGEAQLLPPEYVAFVSEKIRELENRP
jgi:hypothetical protein